MKKTLYFLAITSALALGTPAQQAQPGQPAPALSGNPSQVQTLQEAPDLTRFDLHFEGGTPQELVDRLKEQLEVFNAIVQEEYQNVKLPALHLQSVNVIQLFQALEQATRKRKPYLSGSANYGIPGSVPPRMVQERTVSMGFTTMAKPVTQESVWTFYAEDVPELPVERSVQFFQLNPYLEAFKIDDITTAIQAGWKMLQEPPNAPKPELNFHQETKLLIAAGTPAQLETIRSVLSQLWLGQTVDPVTGLPAPKPALPARK